jgi:hypothetical protein
MSRYEVLDETTREILNIIQKSSDNIPDIFTTTFNSSTFLNDVVQILGPKGRFIPVYMQNKDKDLLPQHKIGSEYITHQLQIFYTMNRIKLYNEQQKVNLLISLLNDIDKIQHTNELKKCLNELDYIFGSLHTYKFKELYAKHSVHLID